WGMGRDQCSALTRIPGVELVAVADLRPEALERLGKQLELPWTRFYGDAAELLDKESPDVLCIATTAPSHVALARMAVEAGVRREDRLVVIQGEFGRIVVDERARVWRAATSFSPELAFPFRATFSPGGLFSLAVRELLGEPPAVACGPRDGLAATEMAVAAHL